MQRKRRQILQGIGATGIAGLAGCLASDQAGDTPTETSMNEDDDDDGSTPTPTPEPMHVGMVYALGGLGDKSFNDMAHQGVQDAADQLPVEYKNAEPERAEDFSTLQKQFAQSSNPAYDLVCTIGFAQTSALVSNAQQFTDQKFMLIDSVAKTEGGDLLSNVANYVFDEHKGSFQVGHMAGLLTTMDYSKGGGSTNDDTVVGFVGGKEIPLIKKFQAGYETGVAHADSGIEVRSAYAGAWTDPAKGKEIALSMINEGADIVYHAAGGTGVGVFQAAQEKGRYAIGVDADQSKSSPEHSNVIIASMTKRVDTAVLTSVENVYNDEFQGGSVNALGLEEDGVAAVIGQDFEGEIPSSITDALESSRQKIIDGEISVPTEP
jgi:basic membrane protein A